MKKTVSVLLIGLAGVAASFLLLKPADEHRTAIEAVDSALEMPQPLSEVPGNPAVGGAGEDGADGGTQAPSVERSEHSGPVLTGNVIGERMSYGERVQFTLVADCTDTFVQSREGEWIPMRDCGPQRLEVDHPYGTYTVEQLEYAANEMNDADAAYILAERFTAEIWRDRRDEAHLLYLNAFLLTSDAEIYQRMLSEMGLHSNVQRRNDELDVQALSANYIMLRVGQMFGAVDDERVEHLARAADESGDIDLESLDLEANTVYEGLLERRERLQLE